jgi:hypothetical protein
MQSKRCWCCQGSKLVMGGGCVFKECHVCSGTGVLEETVPLEKLKFESSPEVMERAKKLSEWAARELAKPEISVEKRVENDVLPLTAIDPGKMAKNTIEWPVVPAVKKRPSKPKKRPLHPETLIF